MEDTTKSKNDKYEFRGFTNSILRWNETFNEWKIILYNDPHIYATCNATNSIFPLPIGICDWYFFNDTCDDIKEEQMIRTDIYKLPLSFSRCNPKEFTCMDGSW